MLHFVVSERVLRSASDPLHPVLVFLVSLLSLRPLWQGKDCSALDSPSFFNPVECSKVKEVVLFATVQRVLAAGISSMINAKVHLCGALHAMYGMYEIGSSDDDVLSWT